MDCDFKEFLEDFLAAVAAEYQFLKTFQWIEGFSSLKICHSFLCVFWELKDAVFFILVWALVEDAELDYDMFGLVLGHLQLSTQSSALHLAAK